MRNLLSGLVAMLLVALLPGCASSDDGFPGHHDEQEADDPDFPGLQVEGILDGSGEELRVDAVARNDGSHTYKVSSICVAPWGEMMARGNDAVTHREPRFACAAFGLRDFAPGDRIPYDVIWNGTVWDDASGRYVPAPSGSYTWKLVFTVYKGGDGAQFDDQAAIPLKFNVKVP